MNKKFKLKLNYLKNNRYEKYAQSHRLNFKNKPSFKENFNLNENSGRSKTYREDQYFQNLKEIYILNIKSEKNIKNKLAKQIPDTELISSLQNQWDNLNEYEQVEFFKSFNPNKQKLSVVQKTFYKTSFNLIVLLYNKFNNKYLVNIDKGYNLRVYGKLKFCSKIKYNYNSNYRINVPQNDRGYKVTSQKLYELVKSSFNYHMNGNIFTKSVSKESKNFNRNKLSICPYIYYNSQPDSKLTASIVVYKEIYLNDEHEISNMFENVSTKKENVKDFYTNYSYTSFDCVKSMLRNFTEYEFTQQVIKYFGLKQKPSSPAKSQNSNPMYNRFKTPSNADKDENYETNYNSKSDYSKTANFSAKKSLESQFNKDASILDNYKQLYFDSMKENEILKDQVDELNMRLKEMNITLETRNIEMVQLKDQLNTIKMSNKLNEYTEGEDYLRELDNMDSFNPMNDLSEHQYHYANQMEADMSKEFLGPKNNNNSNLSIDKILNASHNSEPKREIFNMSNKEESLFANIKDSYTFTFNNNIINDSKLRSYEVKKRLLDYRVTKFKKSRDTYIN